MRPSDRLRAHRAQVLAIAASHRVARLWVFGSAARGDDREDSDLDLLVRFRGGASLLDLAGLAQDLQDLLGCRVDVVSEGGLDGVVGKRIREEARDLPPV